MNMKNERSLGLTTGMDVLDAGGDKIGKIIEIRSDAIVVEKGFFFVKDFVVPVTAIDRVNQDAQVLLTLLKDDLKEDVVNESSDADLELTGSTTFDPTIATGAGIIPRQSGIDSEEALENRGDR